MYILTQCSINKCTTLFSLCVELIISCDLKYPHANDDNQFLRISKPDTQEIYQKFVNDLYTLSYYTHERINAVLTKYEAVRCNTGYLTCLAKIDRFARRRNYLQQTRRKRMLFSRAQNGRAAHEVM